MFQCDLLLRSDFSFDEWINWNVAEESAGLNSQVFCFILADKKLEKVLAMLVLFVWLVISGEGKCLTINTVK